MLIRSMMPDETPGQATGTPGTGEQKATTAETLFSPPPPSDTTKTGEQAPGSLLDPKAGEKTAEQKAADEAAAKPTKESLEKALADAKDDAGKKAAQDALDAFNKSQEDGTLRPDDLGEGFDKNSPLAKEFLDLVNNKEMTQADRNKGLLELGRKLQADFETKSANLWLEMNQQFQTETVKHYGGEAKLEPVLHRIGSLIEHYDQEELAKFRAIPGNEGKEPEKPAGKSLRQAMTLTGAGNHPEMVKFLDWVSNQLGEALPLGGRPTGQVKTTAQKLYDNQT
jgi:hypothetical protein